MLHNESIQFMWESPEFEYQEKTKRWYWVVAIVATLLIVLAIILKNYLFGFFVVVGLLLTFILSTKKPMILPIEVSQRGIRVYNDMYPYEKLFAFWITYNSKNEPMLLLLSSQRITPLLSYRIGDDIELMELREFLAEFIEEQEMQDSMTNRIIERIGF